VSKKKLILLILLPVALFLISLFFGRYPISPLTVIQVLASKIFPIGHSWPDAVETVIFQIRLPRALLAMFVGASLSISGAAYQGMFRNPLVSPDILGVSAAAGFGAALAILLSGNSVAIQVSAFAFGILGVILTYLISRVYKTTPILMLVLSGVVVSAFFGALISVTKFVADPYQKLPAITFWLMGSLSTASLKDVVTVLPSIFLGTVGLMLVRWRINVLSMGDEEARSLGVNTERLKIIIIVCATLLTAAAVCVSGIIGWVGLIIPHVGRMLVGPDHRWLLPASIALGAAYVLLMDDLARIVTSAEIPLGILTAIIGAPFFAYLLRRSKGGWT
jgi:iron complex transport system permease protein